MGFQKRPRCVFHVRHVTPGDYCSYGHRVCHVTHHAAAHHLASLWSTTICTKTHTTTAVARRHVNDRLNLTVRMRPLMICSVSGAEETNPPNARAHVPTHHPTCTTTSDTAQLHESSTADRLRISSSYTPVGTGVQLPQELSSLCWVQIAGRGPCITIPVVRPAISLSASEH